MFDQLLPKYNELLLYNIILFIGYLWFYIKYKENSVLLLIITLFFGGLIMDFGNQLVGKIIFGSEKTSTYGTGLLQVLTFLWAVYLYNKTNLSEIRYRYRSINVLTVLYSIYLLFASIFINSDNWQISVNELYKDIMPFFLFFILLVRMQDFNFAMTLNTLFKKLIIAQVIFSFAKLAIMWRAYEGLVGSITGISNGGPGTTLPLLGLLLIAINSNMNLKAKDLWLLLGLLFTGFLAGKRAVWVVFPALYILLSIYVYRKKFLRNMFFAVILVPLFIYIGLRMTPSLNPENELWGSFDPQYAWDYGLEYSTGQEDRSSKIEEGKGRIGALVLGLTKLTTDAPQVFLFGNGLEHFVLTGDNYNDSQYWWGIDHRGSITGILYKYFAIGLIGVVLYTLYLLSIILNVQNKRLKVAIVLTVLFDYVFYNATIVTFPSLFTLLIFVMLYNPIKVNEAIKNKASLKGTN